MKGVRIGRVWRADYPFSFLVRESQTSSVLVLGTVPGAMGASTFQALEAGVGGVVGGKATGTLSLPEAVYYGLSLPASTAIIGVDSMAQVEENVPLARAFTPLSEAQLASLAQRTESVSRQALFFRFLYRA